MTTSTKVLQMLSRSRPCSTSHCRISLGLNRTARSIASQISSVFFVTLIAHATQLHVRSLGPFNTESRLSTRQQYLPRSWFSRPQGRLVHWPSLLNMRTFRKRHHVSAEDQVVLDPRSDTRPSPPMNLINKLDWQTLPSCMQIQAFPTADNRRGCYYWSRARGGE
ncbi:hypothetical protein IW261DRAFT_575658 [Armillaria novae-zelandiae]|uniref:Uncharacterized protein n=1 Tax=Armillaria novae-zelandiae TaxID=153914 RepID=A0AA39NYK3_9AGAR|nr:hypothetical protein IW261DRAFT_575658 [Armillaria novae-zelandiae]